jgi:hypothetical protein
MMKMPRIQELSFKPKKHVRKDGSIYYTLNDGPGACWMWEAKKIKRGVKA